MKKYQEAIQERIKYLRALLSQKEKELKSAPKERIRMCLSHNKVRYYSYYRKKYSYLNQASKTKIGQL